MTELRFQLLMVACLFFVNQAYADDCDLDRADGETAVTYVHDGDTVFANEHQKIRIIGLDAPELAHDNLPEEPLALQARDNLRQLLVYSPKVKLRFDVQRQDRYRRDLAHLFLADGKNVTQLMLARGLAAALLIPPNLQFAECYLAAQEYARKNKLGIWRLPEWQPMALAELGDREFPVYRIVKAAVVSQQKGRHDYRIHIQDGRQKLTLIIKETEIALFSELLSHKLMGRSVQVQGRINKYHGQLQMLLRHPGYLKLVSGQ